MFIGFGGEKKSMCARMIAFYIVGLSTNTLRSALFVDSDDENCNKNIRKGWPKKVFWYFPIISHLKHWFVNKESELLQWHKEKHKQDAEMIKHPADATQWCNIDS
jgi:hypothetical protein